MQKIDVFAVSWRPLSALKPYPGNPRIIPEAAIEKVAASIKEFGWRQPIVVDDAGVIVAGHTRFLAAKRLKLDRVPVHVATGLTPEQTRAYRLADNRTNEETRWDAGKLELELAAFDVSFEFSPMGFDLGELPRAVDFTPVDDPTSPPLDRLSEFTCPHCGKTFEAPGRR